MWRDEIWEEESGYVKIARNLNFLEKYDNEVDGRNSEEKNNKVTFQQSQLQYWLLIAAVAFKPLTWCPVWYG